MIKFMRWIRNLKFESKYWVNGVRIIKETEKAYLLEFCDQRQWYPKSKIYEIKNGSVKVDDFWLRKFA